MRTRKPIQQFEMSFTASAFNLASESTADGERIQREVEQSARDRAESEARQQPMFDGMGRNLRDVAISNLNERQQRRNLFTNIGEREVKQEVKRIASKFSFRVISTREGSSLQPMTMTILLSGAIEAARQHAVELPGCITRIEERCEEGWKLWQSGNWGNDTYGGNEDPEPVHFPGLRPGSSWSVDTGMRKALATMQGGGR